MARSARARPSSGLERILVVGGTGRQGSAVVRHLLAAGHYQVRFLTRSPGSLSSRRLSTLGAECQAGDLTERSTLRAALSGCRALFSAAGYPDPGGEAPIGTLNLINAVANSEIEHFVYSLCAFRCGAAAAPEQQCRQKELEDYAVSLELPLTLIRPALFYESIWETLLGRPDRLAAAGLAGPSLKRPLPGVAADDVGRAVELITRHPDEFLGRTLSLEGDRLSAAQYLETLAGQLAEERPPGTRFSSPEFAGGPSPWLPPRHSGELPLERFEPWLRRQSKRPARHLELDSSNLSRAS